MNPEAFILKVTEGLFTQDSQHAKIVMEELKALGVRIAIDNFGTGYCSPSYLEHL